MSPISEFALALDFVPDVAGLRLLNRLPAELSDVEVAEYAFQRRRATRGRDRLAPHLLHLSGFALFGAREDGFCLRSAAGADEACVMAEAFDACASVPALCRWSAAEARLDALRLRAVLKRGDGAGAWSRLMACTTLATRLCQEEEAPGLAECARLADVPLLRAADDEWQWSRVQAQDWPALQAQAELRALSAWLLQLRGLSLAGAICRHAQEAAEDRLRAWLLLQPGTHLQGFAAGWKP